MKSKAEILKKFKKDKKLSDSKLGRQYSNTRECQAFYAGDFMDYVDTVSYKDGSGNTRKKLVQFNKVKPYVNAVSGFFIQNRSKPKYIARIADNEIARLFSNYTNSLSEYVRDEANAAQKESQSDKDMLIGGYSAINTAITYQTGGLSTLENSQIVMGRVDPLSVWWDPNAREFNLLDARWVGETKVYDVDDAVELFDEKEEDFEPATDDHKDMIYFPEGGAYDKVSYDFQDEGQNLINVHFYQWYDVEDYYRAENPIRKLTNSEEIILYQQQLVAIEEELRAGRGEFDPENVFDSKADVLVFDSATKSRLLDIFEDLIEPKSFKVKRYYTAVISGEKVFSAYESICQKGFSLKFKTGDFDEKNKIWVGMVNSLKEPTLYYNKALTELMYIIGSNSKGGVMYEESAVDDPDNFEAEYAKTDSAVKVNDGALSGGQIQEKKTPAVPTGYENIIGISDAAISDVSAIDKTFLGSSENRLETAQLQRQRVKQIISTMANFVDSILLFQKEHARLMLDYLRVFAENNSGLLFPVLGQDGDREFIQISEDKLGVDFLVAVEESPETKEEKQEYVSSLTLIGDKLIATGDPSGKQIYAIAAKYMSIEQEDKEKLREILNPEQEEIDPNYVKQLEQALQQMQSEQSQVAIKKALSDIALNESKAIQANADANKKAAETTETLEKTKQTELENNFISSGRDFSRTNLNVNI